MKERATHHPRAKGIGRSGSSHPQARNAKLQEKKEYLDFGVGGRSRDSQTEKSALGPWGNNHTAVMRDNFHFFAGCHWGGMRQRRGFREKNKRGTFVCEQRL